MVQGEDLTVSVVMPTYRRRALLSRAVQPLLASEAIEVIVVVDGVDDGSMELLECLAATAPQLRPVWRENGGEGAARQTGLEHAKGDIVLFLDDDVLAEPGLVNGHAVAHADAVSRVVLGYMPTRVPPRRSPGQFATFLYREEYEQACRRYEDGSTNVLTHLWAGNMSLRTRDALRVGMIGDGFRGLYHADQDFGLRCAAAGLTGYFDRNLVSEHAHDRPLTAFVRDARAQGAGRVRLSSAHPTSLPPADDETFVTGLPGPLRTLAGSTVPLNAACDVLRAAVPLLGAARLWRAESGAARILRRFEQVRGAREERTALASSRAGAT